MQKRNEPDRFNILVLHALGDPARAPAFLKRHVFFLRDNIPKHNYLYHDASLPLPSYVLALDFHAIILDVTFLCYRWADPPVFQQLKEKYDFVRFAEAVKIALPQDEYDCNELLDDWMCDWRVDCVVSVIDKYWDVLYPKYSKSGRIILGYTGYVDETLLNFAIKPWAERRIDIGYRARKLPPYFGRLGQTKWRIGPAVEAAARPYGFITDIVVGEHGTLRGKKWLDFINNSKFTLGANSGSSLLDPRGEIQRKVRAYLRECPYASFEEIEEKFFKGLDGKYEFAAISPRVLESAMLNSGQILVKGEYSGLVRPWEHYIPIMPDASDFANVATAMRNQELVRRLIANCRAAILDTKALRYSTHAERMIGLIRELIGRKHIRSPYRPVEEAIRKYQQEMPAKYARVYLIMRSKATIHQWLVKFPTAFKAARMVLHFLRK